MGGEGSGDAQTRITGRETTEIEVPVGDCGAEQLIH
jgi:hypothetical protein